MSRVLFIVLVSIALSACRDGGSSPSTKADNNQTTSSHTQAPPPAEQTPTRQLTSPPQQPETAQPEPEQPPTTTETSSDERVEIQPNEPTQTVELATVSLEWTIPLQRENGDPLGVNDLDGFIIEYSTQGDSSDYDVVYVEGGLTNHRDFELIPGRYQFRVIAVDTNGLQSEPSEWVEAELI